MNDPTEKQIEYILALTNGKWPRDAYYEMARDMGCSTTSAERRATKQDASRTITRLRRAQPDSQEATS